MYICQGSQRERLWMYFHSDPLKVLLHSHKKQLPVKCVALSASEQILSRPHPDPPKLREGRREAEIPIFQYYPSSATSCRNLAAARRHPIHTYESLWSSCRIQAGLLGTDRKAPNVFAARGGCWHPCTRASCTSPAPHVTTPGNVTFYRLLGVTLSRRAGGTIPSDMVGTALRNFPGLDKLSQIRFQLLMAVIAPIKSATYGERAATIF